MRKLIEKKLVNLGIEDFIADIFSWYITIFIMGFFIFRVGIGMHNANEDGECIVRRVNDILISPFYAPGCNMAKNRCEYKLN